MSKLSKRELIGQASRHLAHKPTPQDILWLNFAVTYRCNSRCMMCAVWKKYWQQPELLKEELTIDSIEKLAKSFFFRNLAAVSFTGGEPFLRKDFTKIVGLFVREHPNSLCAIATNGLNTDLTLRKTKEIESLYDPHHLSISVSLDGILGKHDELRGVPGAFTSVSATLDRLKSETSANIGIDFTITPWNYEQLLAVYDYAKEHNVKFVTCFAHHSNTYYGNEDTQFDWNDKDYEEIENALNVMIGDKIRHESPWEKITDPNAFFLSHCTSFERKGIRPHVCYSGTHSMFLDPYGNVYPCLLLDRKLGNIKELDFESLWSSAEANALRADIRAGSCGCWVGCEAIPSVLRDLRFVRWNLRNKFQFASRLK